MNRKEIGGYIELDTYRLPMLHDGAIALNCGRNALAYLIRAKKIAKVYLPKFICDSVIGVCQREGVDISFYRIDLSLKPVIDFELQMDEWLYLVNYYGQLSDDKIKAYKDRYHNIIVDQAQSYFQLPLNGVDTLYTCRKYFGVPDGAFLYTDQKPDEAFPQDESFERMHFLLGRYERTASEFYSEYVENNHFFENEPIKYMSKLTCNLLHAIDYSNVKQTREANFRYLHQSLKSVNQLKIDCVGTFMYPLLIDNGAVVRKKMQNEKVYIPTLWPSVFNICAEADTEYKMAENILPLPLDQRYCVQDMDIIISFIINN